MFLNLGIWLALSFLSLGTKAIEASPQISLPNCTDTCGNVSIPYPFGVTEGCFMNSSYFITCNYSTQEAYLGTYNIEVLDISLGGQATFNCEKYGYQCNDISSGGVYGSPYGGFDLSESPFWFSATKNMFIATGCDSIATFSDDQDIIAGCISVCSNKSSLTNGSCSGIDCCQTPVPWGLKSFNVSFESYYDSGKYLSLNPCSFAFLAMKDWFTFDSSDISSSSLEYPYIPVAIDWAIGNQTCEEAQQDAQSYACGPNTFCSNSTNGIAYLCNCKAGFEGNPYILPQGCQDIDECAIGYNNDCSPIAICNNTVGNYSCYCPNGYHGDGWVTGISCYPYVETTSLGTIRRTIIGASVGGGLGLSFLLFGSFWLHKVFKERRKNKLKQNFFQKNGGFLLQQKISSEKGSIEKTKIFSDEELKKATNNYDESRILGRGGQGTVYKGMLLDGTIVAIKKSTGIHDKGQIKEFINEIAILSQISHRNVVKLFGCCLETEVPLLVYEFISNGTLFTHIHDNDGELSFTWDSRLRIAKEVAGALAYLHYAASTPIYHRDIKSTNILLDDRYRAKVSDFGISRSVSVDKTHLTLTSVQGTFGYLDPEYFQSSQFTDKSDVYSFGVLLVELLTGKELISAARPEGEKSLVANFIHSIEESNFFEMLDAQVVEEDKQEELETVAVLAHRCLNMNGKKRPTMKEVAAKLEGLRDFPSEHLFAQNTKQDEDFIMMEPTGLWDTSPVSTTSYSTSTSVAIPLDDLPLLHKSSS